MVIHPYHAVADFVSFVTAFSFSKPTPLLNYEVREYQKRRNNGDNGGMLLLRKA